MQEYKYLGLSLAGKPVQGTIYADNRWDLKKKIQEITSEYKINVNRIQKKYTYLYKVRKRNEKPVYGEQRAFNETEVQRALFNMGFQVLYIRKKIFDFKAKVPRQDIVIFVKLCADLLRQNFPYDEILELLANDTENRTLKETIREIHKDLKLGKEGFQVFGRHSGVLGDFTAHMLSIASTSGNMAEVYDSTAKYLTRDSEFKKSIRNALFMPIVVLIAVIGTMIFYIMYIFPKMTDLLVRYKVEIPPMTKACMDFSNFLQNNILMIILVTFFPIFFLIKYLKTPHGQILWGRVLISIPMI